MIIETALWAAYSQNRTVENRNRLVEHYLPLAKAQARVMSRRIPINSSWDYGTLLTEASLGLIQAIEGFDPGRGFTLSTYADQRVRGAMLDAVRRDDFVPRRQREASKETGAACVEMVRMSAVATADDSVRFEDTVPDREYATDDPDWLDHPQYAGLSELSRTVLDGYYRRGKLMREIGVELGISESRVSQIHSRAMEEVRVRFNRDAPRSCVRRHVDDKPPVGRRPADTFPTSDHRELMASSR